MLVIDDEPDVLLLCRVNLEYAGHEVLEAEDGETGIEVALEQHPDLIVLDVMLPRQDGIEILRRLHAQEATRDVPVILLTAKAGEQDQMRGWRTGADGYVTKPFSPVALIEAVAQVGRLSDAQRAARRRENLDRLTALERL